MTPGHTALLERAAGHAAPQRARLLVFPREHGAWGILLVPLVAGAWLGYQPGRLGALALFTLAVLAVFLLRTPLEAWLGRGVLRPQSDSERALVRRASAAYAVMVLLAGGALLRVTEPAGLLPLAAAAAAAGVAQSLLQRRRREQRVPAQAAGALGLAATAPGAYYVAAGALDATAFLLWAVSWLFAVHQIHYVHLRLAAARAASRREKLRLGCGFLAAQPLLAAAVVLAALAAQSSPLLAVAFVPALARAAAWFLAAPAPLAVHRLGVTELAHNLLFGALVIALLRG
jgi:hypothetical protein